MYLFFLFVILFWFMPISKCGVDFVKSTLLHPWLRARTSDGQIQWGVFYCGFNLLLLVKSWWIFDPCHFTINDLFRRYHFSVVWNPCEGSNDIFLGDLARYTQLFQRSGYHLPSSEILWIMFHLPLNILYAWLSISQCGILWTDPLSRHTCQDRDFPLLCIYCYCSTCVRLWALSK